MVTIRPLHLLQRVFCAFLFKVCHWSDDDSSRIQLRDIERHVPIPQENEAEIAAPLGMEGCKVMQHTLFFHGIVLQQFL